MVEVEEIEQPDVENLLVDYLTAKLAFVGMVAAVGTVVPLDRPAAFILVPQVGGARRDLVTWTATVAVECWAESARDASRLARRVQAWLFALSGRTVHDITVYGVASFSGVSNLPDPLSAYSRYVFTLSLTVRGTVLPP